MGRVLREEQKENRRLRYPVKTGKPTLAMALTQMALMAVVAAKPLSR
jgi:hypothetical protein